MPNKGFGEYLVESRRPLTSLAFLAVPLLIYELGVLTLRSNTILESVDARNGIDVLLRDLLQSLGFGQYFLLPVLTVGGLLAWHHTTGDPWRVSWGVAWGMLVECTLLAAVLVVMVAMFGRIAPTAAFQGAAGSEIREWLGKFVTYLGAGIYEEVLFRLILLSLCSALIGIVGGSPRTKTIGAVILTSIAFSAAHYLPGGDTFELYSFSCRIVAGLFFAVLMLRRGFGIAAGTHAGYDILVGILLPNVT
jgi:membrane protease YdiL (CAAX protease family)